MRKSLAFILAAMTMTSCMSMSSGWKALDRGDYSGAREIAAYHLAQDPMNPEVYQLTASTYLAENRADDALRAAKFAVSLDETNEEASALLQKTYGAKKDWAGLCEEVDRASEANLIHSSNDALQLLWHEGAAALLSQGQAEGWACYRALSTANADVRTLPDPAASRRAYANALVKRGRFAQAIELLESSSDPYDRFLMTASVHYRHLDREPAREKLRQYVADPSASDREKRLMDANDVAQDGRDYEMADELLTSLNTPNSALDHALIKLRLGQKAEAQTYNKAWFSVPRDTDQYLSGISALLGLGFADLAWEGCEVASFSSSQDWFKVADTFITYGFSSYARNAVENYGESNRDDVASCMETAMWFTNHRYSGEAIRWSERAMNLGTTDAGFARNLMELYAQARDFRSLQRSAAAYLVSQSDRSKEAKCEVATIYYKLNDFTRTYELLSEAAKEGELSGFCESRYLSTLQKLGHYETLYALLEKKVEAGDLSRTKMASWFESSAETEKEFKNALAPMRTENADAGHRRDAEYMAASYAFDILNREDEADEALNNMLKATNGNASSYDNAASFWMSRRQYDKALSYAEIWLDKHPADPNASLFIGNLHLKQQHFEDAAKAFDDYVDKSAYRKPSFNTVLGAYQSGKADDEGYAWFKALYERRQNRVNPDLELMELYASTTLNESRRLQRQSPAKAEALEAESLSAYETLISQDKDDLRMINYGHALSGLDQYAMALRAYDKVEKSPKYSEGIRLSHTKACLKTGCEDAKIRRILSGIKEDANWTNAVSLLRDANRTELAKSHFEEELVSQKLDHRIAALNELISLSLELGERDAIPGILTRFEGVAPTQPQTRTSLLQAAIRLSDWDEAVRHLTFLIQNRPDTRETFEFAIRLSQLAPENADAQRLLQTLTRFAEGATHRLQWIAETYENMGLYQDALRYYLLADASSAVSQEQLQFHILLMSIAVGDQEITSKYRTLIESSVLWNHERMYQLSLAYEEADDLQNAHTLLEKAIELDPENTRYRSHHLVMTLRSRNTGLIMKSLTEAIRHPTAEVMNPLADEGAWLDAIDAVDQFVAIGQYEMAASSLIRIEEPYILKYGSDAYRRKLEDISAHAVQFQEDAETALSMNALESEQPATAIAHLSNVYDGKVWAYALIQNKAASASLLNQLEMQREKMSANARHVFDISAYKTLLEQEEMTLSDVYTERFGLIRSVSDDVSDALLSQHYADAARLLAASSLDSGDFARSLAELASRGYLKEAQMMAKEKYAEASLEDRPLLAVIRLLAGEQDSALNEAISRLNRKQIENLPTDVLARVLRLESMESLFKTTPVTVYDMLIHAACRHAFLFKDEASAVHAMISASIKSHPLKSSLWLSYSRRALQSGFIAEALDAIEHAEAILPDNALVQYRKAILLDRAGRTAEALNALKLGMARAANVSLYLKEARSEAQDSSLGLREAIARHQLSITPNMVQAKLDLLDTLLASKDLSQANALAESIYNSADIARSESVIAIFDKHHALESIPKVYTENQTSSAYRASARIEYANKNLTSAATAWHEAAKRSLWPIDLYREALNAMYDTGDMEALEQMAQLTIQTLSNAPEGYVWQSIVLFHKNQTESAIQFLQEACRRTYHDDSVYAKALLYSPQPTHNAILAEAKQIPSLALKSAIAVEAVPYGAANSEEKAKHVISILDNLEPSTFVPYKNADDLSRCAKRVGQAKMAETWILSSEFAELSRVLSCIDI